MAPVSRKVRTPPFSDLSSTFHQHRERALRPLFQTNDQSNDSQTPIASSTLTTGLNPQAAAVATVLTANGEHDVPVQRVLCFTNSDWKLSAKPFTINDVLVTWASKLIETIRTPGPLDDTRIEHISRILATGFPPARH